MDKYLTKRRKALGLTMKQVADYVGVSEGTVSRWESGAIANMRRDRIKALATILQTSPNFIMTGELDDSNTISTSSLYENIKKRREELGMTKVRLAELVGYDRSMITKIEQGKVDLTQSKIAALATALKTTTIALMGENEEIELPENILPHQDFKPVSKRKYKYLGEIACGEPIFADEQYETYIELDSDIHADFVLKAKGDSMINARIHDGDIVFIKEQNDVNDGEIAAVIIDDEATLKRVYKYDDYIMLNAENPAYKPIQINRTDAKNVRIIGKAISAMIYL